MKALRFVIILGGGAVAITISLLMVKDALSRFFPAGPLDGPLFGGGVFFAVLSVLLCLALIGATEKPSS